MESWVGRLFEQIGSNTGSNEENPDVLERVLNAVGLVDDDSGGGM